MKIRNKAGEYLYHYITEYIIGGKGMKKMVITILGIVTIFSNSLAVFAAPKTMSDGTVFDADYYAKNNPDVVAVYGTDESALYQHYIDYGKKEGRLTYAPTDNGATTEGEGHGKVVSSYKHYNYVNSKAIIYTYEDGFQIMKSFTETPYNSAHVEDKYVIPRTDYCDGLLDLDNNGIDDRDPYNSCGYTDLNHNCYADGAPVKESMCSESEAIMYRMCEHGVVNGYEICHQKECVAWRESAKNAIVY